MTFIKYDSIENSYQDKYIHNTFKYHPELMNCEYILEHKLDGSNIQFIFSPDTTMDTFQICSRSHPLNREGSFLKVDLQEIVARYWNELSFIQDTAIHNEIEINIYGELFGDRIQRRINYGQIPLIKFFTVKINGENVSQKQFYDWFSNVGLDYMLPDNFGIVSFEEALDFNTEISSDLIVNDDHIEGIVIKPWDVASSFYLKKKNKKFLEKSKKKTIKNKEFSDNVNYLKTVFNEYLNENRVLSIFSKEGEIDNLSDLGKYIKLVLNDAKEDFFKDGNSFKDLDQNEVRYIMNGSKHVVKILKNYL